MVVLVKKLNSIKGATDLYKIRRFPTYFTNYANYDVSVRQACQCSKWLPGYPHVVARGPKFVLALGILVLGCPNIYHPLHIKYTAGSKMAARLYMSRAIWLSDLVLSPDSDYYKNIIKDTKMSLSNHKGTVMAVTEDMVMQAISENAPVDVINVVIMEENINTSKCHPCNPLHSKESGILSDCWSNVKPAEMNK
jgi:hypothetical protein